MNKFNQNKLKNLPNYEELNRTLKSYYEIDDDILQTNLLDKFKLLESDFEYINLRFLNSFINAQANLYSNDFNRTVEYDDQMDIDVCNDALMDAERYYHLFKRSAIIVDYKKDGYYDYIKALAPTDYFVDNDTKNVFVRDGNLTILFEFITDSKTKIYNKIGEFQEVVSSYDTSLGIIKNGFIDSNKTVPVMPVIEWKYKRMPKAVKSGLVTLEENQITSLTFGLFNANPKLLMQTSITSDMKPEDLTNVFKNYGKTNKIVSLSTGSEMKVFDTGNISVLTDLFDIYKQIVTQKALTLGVDKNAIIVNSKVESGESKKVSLSYINSIRRNFIFGAKIFDNKVFNVMIDMEYKIRNYKGISFNDIELVQTQTDRLNYANEMYKSGYWTFQESYAYVNEVSIQVANEEINDKQLKPSNNYFLES